LEPLGPNCGRFVSGADGESVRYRERRNSNPQQFSVRGESLGRKSNLSFCFKA